MNKLILFLVVLVSSITGLHATQNNKALKKQATQLIKQRMKELEIRRKNNAITRRMLDENRNNSPEIIAALYAELKDIYMAIQSQLSNQALDTAAYKTAISILQDKDVFNDQVRLEGQKTYLNHLLQQLMYATPGRSRSTN